MKTYANCLITFAAGATMFGALAFGQMKADIPFPFRTANASLPAGTYSVARMRSNGVVDVIELHAPALRKSVLVTSAPPEVSLTPLDRSSIIFACGSNGCELREIKTGNLNYSYPAHRKAAHGGEAVTLVSLPLIASSGD